MTTFKYLTSFTCLLGIGATAAFFSGCGDREIKSYDVPREQAKVSSAVEAPEEGAPITYVKPAGWKELQPGNMRFASFSAASKNGVIDISITPIPGSAGSMLANVNRWRGQLELPEITEADLKGDVMTVAGEKVTLFDMASTKNLVGDSRKRTLAAAVLHDGMQWFFKATGDEAGVGEQKDAFVSFLGTVRFHEHAEMTKADQDPAPASVVTSAPPAAMPGEASGSGTPSGWKSVAPGPMLLSEYALAGQGGTTAKVTISSFPGNVGGLVANVNRWRAQVSLPAQTPDEIEKSITHFNVGSISATLLDVQGTAADGKPVRLMAAIVPRDGNSWIYKLIGDVVVVTAEKDKFIKFVESSH